MHEREELTRLNGVEEFIQSHANRFSNGDPMLAEDLEQEAREAGVRRLREDPDCPDSHLVVKARDAIYHYRRKGSSVDGKLDARSRSKHYHTVSLEAPIAGDGRSQEEAIGDPQQPRRPTEETACTNILFDSLRDNLTEKENQALALRLMGLPWTQVGETLGQGELELGRIRERITTTACVIWRLDMTEQKDGRDEKRAYTRTPQLPEELPPTLLAVLTGQERQALEAYQRGGTQEQAAQESGLSQATVSRLLAFVWEACQREGEEITPRVRRYKRDDRREQLLGLFYSRPAGELVTYEELLALFSDVKNPPHALWMAISRYNKELQLEGQKITLVRRKGYVLVEDEDKTAPEVTTL